MTLPGSMFAFPLSLSELWGNFLRSQLRRPHTWSTPFTVEIDGPIGRLLNFSTGADGAVVPTLVFPPQAGHSSSVVDYDSPDQSQLLAIRASGLTTLYCFDWRGATYNTRHLTIDDYLQFIGECIEHIGGGPVNFVGDCQGGWLATIYAALHPEQVNTLTIAGAPVDYHAGEPAIQGWLQPPLVYSSLVAIGGGVLKGEFMLAAFIAMQPGGELDRFTELIGNLGDPDYLERYSRFEDWFKTTQDIPGDFYLWIVEHLFRNNELVLGTLEIGGETVDLSRIKCPLQLLGGAKDHITPTPQVFALAQYAGTPPDLVTTSESAGGHLGLFMGHEALEKHWPGLLAVVLSHSHIG